MSPKKVPKYTLAFLESQSRKQVQAIARKERDENDIDIGVPLGASTPTLIKALVKKVKITLAVDAGSTSRNDAPLDEDEKIDQLTKELEELKASKVAREKAAVSKKADEQAALPTDQSKAATKDERPKLSPPSTLSEPVTEKTFRVWRMEYAQWETTYSEHYTHRSLLTSLLTALGVDTKESLFSEVPKGTLTLEGAIAALDRMHAGDTLLEKRAALTAFRTCKRGKNSLKEFIKQWQHARNAAVVAGVLPTVNEESDSWDLLAAAELTASQRGTVLQELATRRDLHVSMRAAGATSEEFSEVDCVMRLLRNLSLAFEADAPESVPTTALFTNPNHGSGGGGGKGGGGKGAQTECWTCGTMGHLSKDCWWQPEWSKPQGAGKGGKGKKGAKGAKGTKGSKGSKGAGKGSKGAKEGADTGKKKDWTCPKCQAHVFGSKDACFRTGCAGVRPSV